MLCLTLQRPIEWSKTGTIPLVYERDGPKTANLSLGKAYGILHIYRRGFRESSDCDGVRLFPYAYFLHVDYTNRPRWKNRYAILHDVVRRDSFATTLGICRI